MKHFKQFLFGALAMVASALLFTSCVDNLSEDYNLAEGVVKLIPCTVTAQNADNTKVSLDYNKQQRFESGDQLYVKGEQLEGTLDLVSGGGKTTATFQGMLTYTGSGSEPSPELALDLKLISAGDAIGNTEFLGGIASSMTEAVSKFSTLTAQITYGQLNNTTNPTTLSEGTAFVDFTATLNPAPGNGDYEAVLFINGGSTRLGAAEVEVLNGTTRFALAFPGGTTLNKPMVSIQGQDFKFGGNNPTVEAAKIYYVNKTNSNDLYTPVTIEAITAGEVYVSIPKQFSDDALYAPYPSFPRFGCLSYVVTNSSGVVVEEGSIGRDGQIETKGSDPSDKYFIATISVQAGDQVSFYGNNHMYMFYDPRQDDDEHYTEEEREKFEPKLEPDDMLSVRITCPQVSYIYGNVMSLVDSAGFATKTSFTDDLEEFALAGIFNGYAHGGNHITFHNTRKLLLPATGLTAGCYAGMFGKCVNIETAPALPAYELPPLCYIGMFGGCSSLRTVSDFHVKEWPIAGCMYMFWDCTSLVKAPALTADSDEVGAGCFNEAFEGCTNLTTAPALPFTTLNEGCYMAMFAGCELLSTTPQLPATTVATGCYYNMFRGCTNLKSVTTLPAAKMEIDCYNGMFAECTSLTTPPARLPATVLEEGCYKNMFYGCSSLSSAPVLPATDLSGECYQSMFSGCTRLTTAPDLPALTLAGSCYEGMFSGCSNLNYIKCMATDISAGGTYGWVSGVAAEGKFVRNPAMTDWTIGANGIPTGWIVDPSMDDPDASTPLTLKAAGTCTITINNPLNKKIYFLKEGGNLENSEESSISIELTAGQSVQLYGKNTTYAAADAIPVFDEDRNPDIRFLNDDSYTNISFSSRCSIYGNIMSLVLPTDTPEESITDPANFKDLKELPAGVNTFAGLFMDQDVFDEGPTLRLRNDASRNILLPATTLTSGCYYSLFCGSGLERVPELPAVNLSADCYGTMFLYDINIESVPSSLLPAKTLQPHCYEAMFTFCTNLLNTPELPAKTTAEGCYAFMFAVCENLMNGPSAFAAEELANYSCLEMFMRCETLSSFPTIEAVTVGKFSCKHMFYECTSLVTAPEIRATNLKYMDDYDRYKHGCFEGMFYDCTNLTTPPPVLPATTLRNRCYDGMFNGCTSLTTAPRLPAETLERGCYSNMFKGCTSLVRAPELPATSLVESCYEKMFQDCSNLNYIKCLATDLSGYACTANWTEGVAATGTFVREENMTGWTQGIDGIPYNWLVLPGEFSVSATKKVAFASGNLYVEDGAYGFDDFDHYVRHPNGENWTSIPTTRNLFTWNELGVLLDGSDFDGQSSDHTITGNLNLEGHNWRMLTMDEWLYLLGASEGHSTAKSRSNAHALRGPCTIGGIFGLLIAPDGYTESLPTTATTIPDGCVFLPAAGAKTETSMESVMMVGRYGVYNSASTERAGYSGCYVTMFNYGVDEYSDVFYVNPDQSLWKAESYISVRLARDLN